MAPEPVANPERRFVLTRLEAGGEVNAAVGSMLPSGYTTDGAQRGPAFNNAKLVSRANPDTVYLLYSPSSGGPHTDADRCWDSRINPL